MNRFQVGTRKWVFNRVENWLDDGSSQNRVMVISGNAGMGKSVIAAVICKGMQEAGRFSGSHFRQLNNVRCRNPDASALGLSLVPCPARVQVSSCGAAVKKSGYQPQQHGCRGTVCTAFQRASKQCR